MLSWVAIAPTQMWAVVLFRLHYSCFEFSSKLVRFHEPTGPGDNCVRRITTRELKFLVCYSNYGVHVISTRLIVSFIWFICFIQFIWSFGSSTLSFTPFISSVAASLLANNTSFLPNKLLTSQSWVDNFLCKDLLLVPMRLKETTAWMVVMMMKVKTMHERCRSLSLLLMMPWVDALGLAFSRHVCQRQKWITKWENAYDVSKPITGD